MASYVELIRNDIFYHESREDASFSPSFVSQFVQSLQNELKLPSWLRSDSIPYINEHVVDLLNQLRTSDNGSHNDLWDDADRIVDDTFQQCLRATFNTALVDCARIQAVLATEQTTGTTFPKQSFLAVLVRNAMFNADPGLCSLDDVPVVLPRHFSGESIPILKYMSKRFLAPLIVSICQEMPVEDHYDIEYPSSDGDEDDTASSIRSLTMSEFLTKRTIIHEEEEEKEEEPLPPQFEAFFLAPSSSIAPPSTCHIPVLCMGDKDQLPIMMSSFLYQRRVWDISDPLVGVELSKYDTVIKLYVGWLEDDVSSDCVLPRVHLGVIGTPVKLDLSSPSIALAVSRLLCGLESHIVDIRDTVNRSVGAVISKTRSHSSLSWRIDTDVPQQDLGSNLSQDTIIRWTEHQQLSECERTMTPKKKVDKISISGSATSKASSQESTTVKTSNTTSTTPSEGKSLQVPNIQEPHGKTDSGDTRFSCSKFAATSEEDEYRVFRWMFDRQVVPQCIPSDLEFREKYKEMTCIIWPEAWNIREDLPRVDDALEPYVQELVESVAALEARSGAVNRIPLEKFPVDLRILEQYFSTIFQASHRSREKKELAENVYEASWRFDHDRLLFDFFIRLIQEGDTACTPKDQSIAHLEDPLARPTLETTLRLPRSDLINNHAFREGLRRSLYDRLLHRSSDLLNWVSNHGGALSQYDEEIDNHAYAISQWTTWREEIKTQTKASATSILRGLPSTGRCDALGRLLVELPNLSFSDIKKLQLVVRTACGKPSASKSKSSVAVEEPTTEAEPLSDPTITSKAQKTKISTDNARLELPILAVEYKKGSDTGFAKGTNQVRMYLTASVKFLQAIGIRNVPVYGVQTDGPIVALPVAILKNDGFVYVFERLVERLDISTALGAWHYATILCRLAHNHAKDVEREFEKVKDGLMTRFHAEDGHALEEWTIEYQKMKLTTVSKPPQI